MAKFKVGEKIKLSHYEKYHDYIRHTGQIATIKSIESEIINIIWNDGTSSSIKNPDKTSNTMFADRYALPIRFNNKILKLKKEMLK